MYIFRINYLPILMMCWMLASCASEETAATTMVAAGDVIDTDESIELTTQQFAMAKMKFGSPERHEFPAIIPANGVMEVPMKQQAAVSALIGGYVKNVSLAPGQRVQRGQLLFSLENPEFIKMQEAYLDVSEKLSYLKTDFERQQTLANENIASEKNLLKATSDYRAMLARQTSLKAQLALINIDAEKLTPQNLAAAVAVTAPISGYLSAVNIIKGMFLNPTDVAVEISDTDQLEITLDIYEKDILAIKEGQPIFFRVPDVKNTTVFEAQVRHIEHAMDMEKRVVHVHGLHNNTREDSRLLPGMYVSAEIHTTTSQSMAVPASALVKENGLTYILVQMDQQGDKFILEKRAVEIGAIQQGWAQLLNEQVVSAENKILVEGAFNLIGIE